MDTKEIFQIVAEQYGVSMEEVERDIETAIMEAYKNPEKTPDVDKMQKQAPCKGDVPTAAELLEFCISKLKK